MQLVAGRPLFGHKNWSDQVSFCLRAPGLFMIDHKKKAVMNERDKGRQLDIARFATLAQLALFINTWGLT